MQLQKRTEPNSTAAALSGTAPCRAGSDWMGAPEWTATSRDAGPCELHSPRVEQQGGPVARVRTTVQASPRSRTVTAFFASRASISVHRLTELKHATGTLANAC